MKLSEVRIGDTVSIKKDKQVIVGLVASFVVGDIYVPINIDHRYRQSGQYRGHIGFNIRPIDPDTKEFLDDKTLIAVTDMTEVMACKGCDSDEQYFKAFSHIEYVKKLPSTHFQVDDVVKRVGVNEELVITRVNYGDISTPTTYNVRDSMANAIDWFKNVFTDKELEVIKHGNYYWWSKDMSKMEFNSFEDEVEFYKKMNMFRQNIHKGVPIIYTAEQAVMEINTGNGDWFELVEEDSKDVYVHKLEPIRDLECNCTFHLRIRVEAVKRLLKLM